MIKEANATIEDRLEWIEADLDQLDHDILRLDAIVRQMLVSLLRFAGEDNAATLDKVIAGGRDKPLRS